jgi:outer membrane protein
LRVATSVGESGPAADDLGASWSAGVTLSWPIFDGGLTSARAHEADANVRAARAQETALEQQVRLEVEQARLGVVGAKAAMDAAAQALDNAKVRLQLAEGRYAQGVGSVIELGDAQVALTGAAAQRVQADYDLASARAQLIKAVGRLAPA